MSELVVFGEGGITRHLIALSYTDEEGNDVEIWADANTSSKESISSTAEPRTPPAGARHTFPAYRVVTDERPWRPGAR